MNDIEHAAELATFVMPGPIGEAVAVVLGDHSEDEFPDPNIHELAHRIEQAKASLDEAGSQDVLRASATARLVHPGPVGAAIEDLLAYAVLSRSAFRNIHVFRLAAAVLDAAPDAVPVELNGGAE